MGFGRQEKVLQKRTKCRAKGEKNIELNNNTLSIWVKKENSWNCMGSGSWASSKAIRVLLGNTEQCCLLSSEGRNYRGEGEV